MVQYFIPSDASTIWRSNYNLFSLDSIISKLLPLQEEGQKEMYLKLNLYCPV